ncbi:hypothetical protein XEU83M_11995 [Xanthomonas euvesicatoria]|nr:hypothetical protein XEU83M_11995 [Xanthomonas euvesicatoria]KLB34795.1 hypothetical protein XEUV199_10965 [Xanthomonas euvesicatoria]KLB49422.1 hypothetical protein XEUV329_16955 [Xanthomonas euvesicatoria]
MPTSTAHLRLTMAAKITRNSQIKQEFRIQRCRWAQHMQLCRAEGDSIDQSFGDGTFAVLEAGRDLGDADIAVGEIRISVVDVGQFAGLV